MMQVVKQTDEEKMVMYMKCPKKQLAQMLIQCNKILDSRSEYYLDVNDIEKIEGVLTTTYPKKTNQ